MLPQMVAFGDANLGIFVRFYSFYADFVRGLTEVALIATGFAGALLMAQPGLGGFSPYALLGLVSAACVAARDIVGAKSARTFRRRSSPTLCCCW